jgi:asparagine synthase (glutamine-hydrolysing)
VLVESIARRGLRPTVERCAGMFAFAAWDRAERTLHLVRDRFGEKPLYYGRVGRALLFGSELKALRAHPAWRGEIDRESLALYFRFNYVPAPRSIYVGIGKLLPGHIATFRAPESPQLAAYWSLAEAWERGRRAPLAGHDAELVDAVEERLRASVAEQMVADVPLGALLSGGIDSSAVVALMQAQSTRPVHTFTIGFHESRYDEAAHAKAVAAHLGTAHTEFHVTPEEAQAVIPRLPAMYDEPFGDSSQVPTFLVAQLARRHVTVALSGDGGDEAFGGYERYRIGSRLWGVMGRVPRALRRLSADVIRAPSPATWQRALDLLGPAAAGRVSGDRIHKLADMLDAAEPLALYRLLCSHWPAPGALVRGGREPEVPFDEALARFTDAPLVERMMYVDALTYLPDDIMVKVDRATMAVSLESRAPLLDHRLVELAWRLPLRARVRGGRGKWVLREVAYRHVPRALLDRPKQGFGVPIDSWLRGPLRAWADDLLSPERLRRGGLLDPAPIAAKWSEHRRGERNWHYHLWDVLMFEAWREAERAAAAVPALGAA